MNKPCSITRGLALILAGILLGGCVSVHREVPETTTTTTSTRAGTLAPAATTTTVQRTTSY